MKILKFLVIVLIAVALSACGKKKHFIVQGQVAGIGSQTVVATYFSGGGIKRISTAATDDKFAMRGEANRPTLVTLSLSDGTPLGVLIAENGDKLTLKGDLADPYAIEVSGNGDSEDIADWVHDNAALLQSRNAAQINESIARWVGKNRSSKAATALLVSYFRTPGYETMADSLMTLLSSKARAQDVVQNFTGVLSAQLSDAQTATVQVMYLYEASDSVITYNPHSHKASLMAFMSDNRSGRDSITSQLRRLTKAYDKRRFTALEISSAPDSASWRSSIADDSVTWHRTWAPASTASSSLRPLAVPRLPYFIVADSAGNQIYRGPSVAEAGRVIESRLK